MIMNLPKVTDLDVAGKRVLLRLDLDTNPDPSDLRIKSSFETLDYLKDKNASEITIIAHKGRPSGVDESLSLKPFQPIFDKWGAKVHENLRFDSREMEDDGSFAKELSQLGDIFVNESFAESHRKAASIVGVPRLLPHAVGFRFVKEVENLSKVLNDPKRPLVFIISGKKEDKLEYVKAFESPAESCRPDRILVGGRLPEYLGDRALESVRTQKGKVIVGNLVMDKEDITLNTIEKFEEEVRGAGTIVVSGPLGKFEEGGHRQGTEKVFLAVVANKNAFKVAGGGNTEEAINKLGISDQFDWVSVGGGAMLEFLAKGTLPGIEAILEN